jgi:hypothetical protein
MKYSLLLQQNEKQVLESLQKQFNITLSGEYPADFQVIKETLKKRWEELKKGDVSLEALSTFESQVKYMKDLDAIIKTAYDKHQKEIADRRSLIHDHFNNWA